MRIGMFGGSFDPIHNGHVGLALRAAREHRLDKVLVIPAHVSPFKTDTSPLPDAIRWQAVEAVCKDNDIFEPCDIEISRGGVSFAIDTVREVMRRNEGAEIYFIVGDDSVEGLPRWKEWETLRKLVTFVSYPRTRESSTEVRRRIASNEQIDDLVPVSVLRILKENHVC